VTTLLKRLLIGTFITTGIAMAWVPIATAQTRRLSVAVSGTLAAPSSGQCANGYANQCTGDNSTPCENFINSTPATLRGIPNKPRVVQFCMTLDRGNNVNAPNNLDGASTCSPIFGQFTAESTPATGCIGCFTEFNFAGVFCQPLNNSSVATLEGGYGIGAASSPVTGWGTLLGTLNNSTGAFTLKLKGTGTGIP
jgi:hypothetical protein